MADTDSSCETGSCSPQTEFRYGVGFSLWLTCNAECAHCLTNSSPRAREQLSVDVVKKCLTEAAEMGFTGYQVTGGEPTIFPKKLLDIMEHSHALGMSCAMTTNAFYAKTVDRAKKVLEPLQQLGLNCVRISTDTYHDPYIPFERVPTAVEAGLDLGLDTHIEMTLVRKNPKLADTFKALQRFVPPARLFTNGTLPTGTAQNLPQEVFLTRSVFEFRNVGCAQAKSLFVDTDGRAYYCCNFPRGLPGAEPADTSLYCVGNVYEHSLSEIIENMRRSKISDILLEKGPNGLLQLLREKYGEDEIERLHEPKMRYCGLCDFCYSVAGNPALIPLIAEATGAEGHPEYDDLEEAVAKKRALSQAPTVRANPALPVLQA